jgi:hypothetical protein
VILEASLPWLGSHPTRIELLGFVDIQARHAGAKTYPKVAASPESLGMLALAAAPNGQSRAKKLYAK